MRKRRQKRFSIRTDVYPIGILFAIGGEAKGKDLTRWARKMGVVEKNERIEAPETPVGGCCWNLSYGSMIYMTGGERKKDRDSAWYAMLVHEIQHAVLWNSRRLGFGETDDADEFRTYLIQYLAHECFRKLW